MRKILNRINIALVAAILTFLLAIPQPTEVQGLTVDRTTYNSAALSWNKAKEATAYHVYRSDGGEWEYLDTVQEPKYKDNNLTTGVTYTYKVRSAVGIKSESLKKAEKVSVTPTLEKPELKVDTDDGKVKIEISEVEGATGYEIYRDDKSIEKTTETEYIDEVDDSELFHDYKVRASRSTDENTAHSEFSSTEEAALVSIENLNAEVVGENVLVSWDNVDECESYSVYDGETLIADTLDSNCKIEKFDPEHEYKLKVAGHIGEKEITAEKNLTAEKKTLSTDESTDLAVKWAEMIADDDSFTYGTCPKALHYGCYFCGTNGKKGKGYEKTYICNAFVTAAYAHGAGDPHMLSLCEKGSGIKMNEESFGKSWKNVGKPKDLKKGDVLVANKNVGSSDFHHVALYAGDGKIVEAVRKGFSDESIREKSLSSGYYDRFDFVMRYVGEGEQYVLSEKVSEEKAKCP